jgi:hypothetical protein
MLHTTVVDKSLYDDHLQIGHIKYINHMFQRQQDGDIFPILDNVHMDW